MARAASVPERHAPRLAYRGAAYARAPVIALAIVLALCGCVRAAAAAAPAARAPAASPPPARHPGAPGRALATAERFWKDAPCGGAVAMRWRAHAPRSPVTGTVVEGWARFQTPLGPDDFAASPGTFSDCTVNLSLSRWPGGKVSRAGYPGFCELVVHEVGHLVGWPDDYNDPPSDIRYPVMSAANMPAVCADDGAIPGRAHRVGSFEGRQERGRERTRE